MKKFIAVLISMIMVLSLITMGMMNVFADGVTEVVCENFGDATYEDITVSYDTRSEQGSVGSVNIENPIYGNVYRFIAKESLNNTSNVYFNPTNTLVLGENAAANTYAEISYDVRGVDTGSVTVVSQLRSSDGKQVIQLGFDKNQNAVVNNGTAYTTSYGTVNTVFRNVRMVLDLKNKTLTALYIDGSLFSISGAEYPLALGAEATDIAALRIYANDKNSAIGFDFDNLSIITYTSADGTSPVVDKSSLKSAITSVYAMQKGLKGDTLASFNTALSNAVSVYHNQAATVQQVSDAVSGLSAYEKLPFTSVAEKFEDTTYEDITVTYDARSEQGTVSNPTSSDPLKNNIFRFMAKAGLNNTSNVYFNPINTVALGNNATENSYAEISYDLRGVGTSGVTVVSQLRDSSGNQVLLVSFDKNANAVVNNGTAYTTAIGTVNTDFRNVRMQLDLKNKTLKALYIDGELLNISGAEYPLALGADATDIAALRIYANDKTNAIGFDFDNFYVVTYTSETGEALPDRTELRSAIGRGYSKKKNLNPGTNISNEKYDALVSAMDYAETLLEDMTVSAQSISSAVTELDAAVENCVTVNKNTLYEIKECVWEDADGNVVSEPVSGGTLASVTVNKKDSLSWGAVFVVASYIEDEGGKQLYDVIISEDCGSKGAGEFTLTTDLKLPGNISKTSCKLMQWDGTLNCRPNAASDDLIVVE